MGCPNEYGIAVVPGKISLGLGLAVLVVALWNRKRHEVGLSALVFILGAAVVGLIWWEIYEFELVKGPEFWLYASPGVGSTLSPLGGLAVVASAFWTGILSRANERAK